jgi:glutaryl-CoA dehydrogenase
MSGHRSHTLRERNATMATTSTKSSKRTAGAGTPLPANHHTPSASASSADFYLTDELLTPQERAIRDKVRAFCDHEVIPIINDYWERAEFPFELIPKLAALNIAGGSLRGYGCPGMSQMAVGLVALELARGDASVCTFFGVHSGLAMTSIAMLGSEEQKRRWLPAMAKMEKIGAFGLTEPKHGSDAVLLETRARRTGDEYVLDGEKRWIGNASFADVVIIWARDDEGNVGGFLVEKGTPGFETTIMTGKVAKRAVWQTDITLTGVRVPVANRLEQSRTFRDTSTVLTATRSGVAWEAVGHAVAAYEIALKYSQERVQFGKPLASYQIIQQKLATMLANVTTMQLLCLRLAQLQTAGKMTEGMASLAKMHNARLAREVVADAREMLGGNGILLEYHIARHHADIEAVFTYEGTDTIQSLIVGREITGQRAFS